MGGWGVGGARGAAREEQCRGEEPEACLHSCPAPARAHTWMGVTWGSMSTKAPPEEAPSA